MPVDLILPCLNEADALPWVLERIPDGVHPIVVDNGSSDGSLARLRTYNERLKLIANETNQGISVARNQGASAAYGDDAATRRLAARFSELFERQVAVLPVATGTAASGMTIGM